MFDYEQFEDSIDNLQKLLEEQEGIRENLINNVIIALDKLGDILLRFPD